MFLNKTPVKWYLMLKKKHNAIAYQVQEAVAAQVIDGCGSLFNQGQFGRQFYKGQALGPSALYNLVDGASYGTTKGYCKGSGQWA